MKDESLSDKIRSWLDYEEQMIDVEDVKEFVKWCETHSFMTDDKIQVIAISKLKEGAGKELI